MKRTAKTVTTYRRLWMFVSFTVLALVVTLFNSVGTGGPAAGDDRVCSTLAGDGIASLLVIDPAGQRMQLRISDQIAWQAKYTTIDAGGNDVETFLQQSSTIGETESSIVEGCHLYSGHGQYSDHELAVVADEINVQPEMLQRIIPGRLVIVFGGGFVLEIFTGIDAIPLSRWDNLCFEIIRFVDAPFSEQSLKITMDATDALTLYNLARPGLPVIIDQGC